MKRLKFLQQLSIETTDDYQLFERADLSSPVPTAAHQLIRIFAPSLPCCTSTFGECGKPLERLDDNEKPLPALPRLHTVVAHGSTDLISAAVRERAPSIRVADTRLEDVPKGVKHLRSFTGKASDLSRFPQLDVVNVSSCDVAEVVRIVLRHPTACGSSSFLPKYSRGQMPPRRFPLLHARERPEIRHHLSLVAHRYQQVQDPELARICPGSKRGKFCAEAQSR